MEIITNHNGYKVNLEKKVLLENVWKICSSQEEAVLYRPYSFVRLAWSYVCILGMLVVFIFGMYRYPDFWMAIGIIFLLFFLVFISSGSRNIFNKISWCVRTQQMIFGIPIGGGKSIFGSVVCVEFHINCIDGSFGAQERINGSYIRNPDEYEIFLKMTDESRVSVWKSEHYTEALEISETLSCFFQCDLIESIMGFQEKWNYSNLSDRIMERDFFVAQEKIILLSDSCISIDSDSLSRISFPHGRSSLSIAGKNNSWFGLFLDYSENVRVSIQIKDEKYIISGWDWKIPLSTTLQRIRYIHLVPKHPNTVGWSFGIIIASDDGLTRIGMGLEEEDAEYVYQFLLGFIFKQKTFTA